MAHNTIAIVADCDDTLAPDTTVQLLEALGVDAKEFFAEEAAELVEDGWDPALAYLCLMIRKSEDGGPLSELTSDRIEEVGRGLEFYPGVPQCFAQLKEELEAEPDFRAVGLRVEPYVISSGIEDLIGASPLAEVMHGIWACNFSYDSNGKIAHTKRVISFTDKTRYLFLIQKGKVDPGLRNQPYVVNEPMTEDERPIPLRNMIYLGDGPSDIPCMSLLQENGGYVIGILSDQSPYKTWALGYGRRANLTVPPDFREGELGYKYLRQALFQKANEIRRTALNRQPSPGF